MQKSIAYFSYLLVLLSMHLYAGHAWTAEPLNASYKVDVVWATVFQTTVSLKNPYNTASTGWTATFSLPSEYSLDMAHSYGGKYTVDGQNVTVKNLTTNGSIPAGGVITFTMLIVMPRSAPTTINNLQAVNENVTPVPPTLAAPLLNLKGCKTTGNYIISWNSVPNATSYALQQDTASTFPNPKTIAQGNILSKTVTNQPSGIYFYRVQASNASVSSPFSNVKFITVAHPSIPGAPTLDLQGSALNYTLSWNNVTNATSYTLEQDTNGNFANPQVVAQGSVLSKSFVNQPTGDYYYRVSASNTAGTSPYSNIENITVSTTPPNTAGIEHSAWYIDWTSWFTGPPFVIPHDVNLLNVFVGTLMYGEDNKPTLGGFGNMTLSQLDAFTAYCASQTPPIEVKVSIGGAGGMYDRCWDLLTEENIDDFAQGLADFCHAHGLVGVDFDYEAFVSAEQERLVGLLIKAFKTLDPNLQTSLCSNAGFGPNYPWTAIMQIILDAATIAPGNCAVDRFYIMSYYDSMAQEQAWVLGWADWLEANYGFTAARVSVGIDDFDAHAYDPAAFKAWAISQGFSTAHWAFDPARP